MSINHLSCNNLEISEEEIYLKSERLNRLKNKIEAMDNSNHIEALYIIYQDKTIKLSENTNGTFINLTELNDSMIQKLEQFVIYINEQNVKIENIENEKIKLENEHFK
tara:strand:+ start:2631 stop:2954 length:324 start_codon:yes stop_codon:yes gene_type:complete